MMNPASIPQIAHILARNHVLVLACRDAAGSWAAPVFYASQSLDLYFLSSSSSRHAQCIRFDPYFAGAIHGSAEHWRAIVGMQVTGLVEALTGEAADVGRLAYAQRFPFTGGPAKHDPDLERALCKASVYRFRIVSAVVVDNTEALGCRSYWSRDG